MLNFLPTYIRGALSLILYAANTIFWTIPIFAAAFLKLIMPFWKKHYTRLLTCIADKWILINTFNQKLMNNIRWDVKGLEGLKQDGWYLVLANHQSWTDILVLQRIFHRKIPFLKFFLKKELIWVPFLGIAWWALDFPFMKRYSKAFLDKYPHLKGKDIEITRKACEKFKTLPVSVMNFVEGTRFTPEKHKIQKSPYYNLLNPKAGGVAFVLSAMGEQLHQIVNVTIVYPDGSKSFWDFICGKIGEIRVRVEILPVNGEIIGDYVNNAEFRENFQKWINSLWQQKDMRIHSMLNHLPAHRAWFDEASS
ncbi:MAG: acyltransferase [Desulfobacteraceae bacterium]|nr:MAG: acyltransferase [Desulfobacteraceae bacterium]